MALHALMVKIKVEARLCTERKECLNKNSKHRIERGSTLKPFLSLFIVLLSNVFEQWHLVRQYPKLATMLILKGMVINFEGPKPC